MGFLQVPNSGTITPINSSEYSPSYYSSSDEDSDKKRKEPEVTVRPIEFLKTRATTFGTLTGNEIQDKYAKAKRFITRSGSNLPEYQVDVVDEERGYLRRRFSGWRGGVLAAVISAGSVLLLNLAFTICAATISGSGFTIGTIYEAECEQIHTIGLWTHIVINVLGTVLLGSSNYTMQCLSSPTRKEIDEAHAAGRHLDIGVPSLRNLKGWKKKSLFGLLILSTLPLHFLWNSAVFTTTQRLDYQVFVVTPDFFEHSTVDCTQNVSIYISDPDSPYNKLANYARTALYVATTPVANISYDSTTGFTVSPQYYPPDSNTNFPRDDVCNVANALLTNATMGRLQRLSNAECVGDYGMGSSLMEKRGNLLVVTKSQPVDSNATVLLNFRYEQFVSNYTGNNWVCDPTMLSETNYKCDFKSLAKTADESWNLGDYVKNQDTNRFENAEQWPIDYCLSQPTDLGGLCQLQYSLIIMLTVLVANFIKFFVILYFLYTAHDPVLATIGDGIASFLERPDSHTANRPFLDRRSARKFKHTNSTPSSYLRFMSSYGLPLPVQDKDKGVHNRPSSARWKQPQAIRWWSAPSTCRWIITLVLCTITICFAIYLLVMGIVNITNVAPTNPFGLGLGNYYSGAVLSVIGIGPGTSSALASFTDNGLLLGMVTLANIPQVLVSCLYFSYNTVYTSMVSADEWARFTTKRKTLRTTDPVGNQRSTYWLSLPWTYGLPLAAASSILHWLISQSLFLARTEVLDTTGAVEDLSYMQVGYSPLGIMLSILFGSAMIITMVLNGARKLEQGGVLVANNSLAIAAACQPTINGEDLKDAHKRAVQWGAVIQKREDGKGHCCFSAGEVVPPKVGELYI